MIEWHAPMWLAGLLILPMVWWLHRLPAEDSATPVSSLLLWQHAQSQGAATIRLNKTDPLWWLRALIIALLFLTAANPTWLEEQGQNIEVWFDDSASMLTQETDGSRIKLATTALLKMLAREKPATVILHSLTLPNHQLVLNLADQHHWNSAIEDWIQTNELGLQLPEAEEMSSHARHWLVSDGADPGYSTWLETVPITQYIQVGQAHDNSAITRLSLRPSLDNSRLDGIVIISHQGLESVNRQLTILANGKVFQQWPITLAAGQEITKTFSIPRAENLRLSATITPNDALASDDRLELTLMHATPLTYHVQGECSNALLAALSSHPRLSAGNTQAQTALTVVCGPEFKPSDTATLWFFHNDQAAPIDGSPAWHEAGNELSRILLSDQGLRHFVAPTDRSGSAILTAGNNVLIELQEATHRLVKVSLDMDSPGLVGKTEYPLLLLGLIDLGLTRNLIDDIDTAQHSIAESDIVPRKLTIQQPVTRSEPVSRPYSLAPWLIVLALLLLASDLFVASSRRTRVSTIVEAHQHA